MESPFLLAQRLERQLNSYLAQVDILAMPPKEQHLLEAIKRDMNDARLDVRDYELSETRVEQLENATVAKKRIKKVSANLVASSEYNVFGPADVAQFSAQLEHIVSRLI